MLANEVDASFVDRSRAYRPEVGDGPLLTIDYLVPAALTTVTYRLFSPGALPLRGAEKDLQRSRDLVGCMHRRLLRLISRCATPLRIAAFE